MSRLDETEEVNTKILMNQWQMQEDFVKVMFLQIVFFFFDCKILYAAFLIRKKRWFQSTYVGITYQKTPPKKGYSRYFYLPSARIAYKSGECSTSIEYLSQIVIMRKFSW